MADLYDPAFPTLDDNQASVAGEGEVTSESSTVTDISSVPPKMDINSSEASVVLSGGPDACQEQAVPASSCKEVKALSGETARNTGCSRALVAPEVQTFNGSRIFVNTIHEDQEFVPSDSKVCVETYSSNSAPINCISSLPVDGGDANICSVSASDVNTVVSEEIVEIPLRCELEKNSTEHVPVVAGECIVETDHVLEVSECVTVDDTDKREKQPVSDETGIRRSSRIAEKKNQKHQKNTSDTSKSVKEQEVKDKQPEPQESKKTSSTDSKGSRHYDKEKSEYRHKSTHSYGKRGERDHTPDKSRRGSDNSDRHEYKRSESSRRESNRRDSSRRYSHRSESNKSDCDKESNRSLSNKDTSSKGNYRYRSRGQRSHSTRKNSEETSEVKNSSYKHEENSDDQPKREQKQICVDKTEKSDEQYIDLKYRRKFHVDFKSEKNVNSNQSHSPLIEIKPAVVEEPKPPPKKLVSDQGSTLKPEKVKSRWRRSSELEHGDLSSTPVTVFTDPTCPKNLDFSLKKESLSTILEEPLPSGNMSPEKTSNFIESKEKPPHYEPIEDNLYLFERKKSKSKKEVRRMVCDCTLTEEEKERAVPGCTENCLNRLLMIECGSRCAAGELCSNKRFQKKLCIKTEPFKTEKKGWGLRVLEDVAAGQFVMEYVGEVLSPQDFKHRVKQYAKEKNNHYYFMALKCDEIIDATNKGSLSRFINHSCDPNCETQKWTVNGELRIGFFTRRFVRAGDELTFDYQFQRYGKEAQKCFCESESCRGYIGDDKQISLDSYNSSKSSSRRKKAAGEKKREVLEDLSIEEELEKLQVSGGLRNREETLVLARLMVRAEDVHTRNRLLDIILNTTELSCLRLFLDYHGLSLMWSWMADVVDLKLKTKILRALSLLPIPNKTMLLDSKVINLVQKWWLHHSGRKLELDKDSEITETEQSSDSPSGGTTPCGGDDNHEKRIKSCESSPESDSGVNPYLRLRASDTMMFPASSISAVRIKPSSNQSSPTKCEGVEQKCDNVSEHQISPTIDNSCGKSVNNEIKPVETTKSDEESGDTMDEEDERKDDTELSILASQLLESWSGLKEVFRIPRVEQQKRREDEDAVDHRNSERESNRCRDYGLPEHSLKEKDILKDRDAQDDHWKDKKHRDKWRDREKTKDADHHERNTVESRDWREEKQFPKHPKKIRLTEPEPQQPPRPRKVLLPTPPRLTKEERRQLFALEVQQKDQEEALRKQQEAAVGYPSADPGEFGTYNQYYNPNQYDATAYSATGTYPTPYDPNTPYPQQPVLPDCQTQPHSVGLLSAPKKPGILPAPRTALLPTPTFVEPTIQPMPHTLPVPTPQYPEQSTPLQYPEQSTPLQYPEQPAPLQYPEQPAPLQYPEQSAPLTYPAPGLLLQPPPTQMPPFLGAPPPTIAQPAPVLNPTPSGAVLPSVAAPVPGMGVMPHSSGPPNVPGINPVTPAIASPSTIPLGTVPCTQSDTGPLTIPPVEACASPTGSLSGPAALPTAAVPPGFLPNPAQFVNASNRPLYFVHSSSTTSVVNVRDQITIQQAIPVTQLPSVVAEGEFSSPLAKPAAVVRLPPNWKTARDPDGNIYYYHAITRQTQWDPPTLEENEDMDLGTPTFDEPKMSKKKSTTTAAADTSSELAKKIKELFRAKMSTFIVQCLNPYRKPDCQVGRITSSDDFKHLARKLTHIVMAKELKHCKNVEHLECNDNVKMKAKDFTQKYMAKQGPVYKKESSSKCN